MAFIKGFTYFACDSSVLIETINTGEIFQKQQQFSQIGFCISYRTSILLCMKCYKTLQMDFP